MMNKKPEGVTAFYDGTKLLGLNGDGNSYMVFFYAVSTLANQWLDIWIDITGGTGTPANLAKLYPYTDNFPKGSGFAKGVLYSLPVAYSRDTWEANGGVVKVRSNANVDVYGMTYNVKRYHQGR